VKWFILAQDRDQWRALVNTVMSLLFPYNVGNVFTSPATISFSSSTALLESGTCCTCVLCLTVRIEYSHTYL